MFKKFSVFVECSSGRLPSIAHLKDFATVISKMGYNAIYLGTSDTLVLKDEPYFGYLRGGYTTEEIKELDAYCKAVGVELCPATQTLAKFHYLGKYEAYSGYYDTGNILMVGEEKVYALLDKMFAFFAESYTSRTINIGMDEAFALGTGAYLSKYGYEARSSIMTKHLKRVAEIAQKYGFQCEMWSDMFIRIANGGADATYDLNDKVDYSKIGIEIPDNITIVYWDYVTNNLEKCDGNIKKHLSITPRVSFCGAVWEFMGFAPDNRFSISIADNAIQACQANQIEHFQIALWMDTGGECSFWSILPSLFYYAEKAKGKTEIDKKLFFDIVGEEYDVLMKVDKVNDPHWNQYTTLNNKSFYYLWQDVFLGEFNSLLSDGINASYARTAKELEVHMQGKYGYVFATLTALCKCLSIKAELGKTILSAYQNNDVQTLRKCAADIPQLLEYVDELRKCFTVQWDKESKAFGFEKHLMRIGTLKERLIYAKERLDAYVRGDLQKIDELEVPHQPFGFLSTAKEDDYMYTHWDTLVSVNK